MNSLNKAYQFQFEVLLHSLIVEYTSSFNFKITLKRGIRNLETRNTMKYEIGGRKEVKINEQLNILSTFCVKKDVLNLFQEKKYKLYLQVYTKQGFKNATFNEINLSKYLEVNYLNMSINDKNNLLELDFLKHPFEFLKMKIFLNVKFVSEIDLTNLTQSDLSRYSIDLDLDDLEKAGINYKRDIPNNAKVGIKNTKDEAKPITSHISSSLISSAITSNLTTNNYNENFNKELNIVYNPY